jgi:uncharacterized protein
MAKRKRVDGNDDSVGHMTGTTDDGVSINLVSSERLDVMSGEEKLQFILEEVLAGKILVLEHGLTPQEEAELIAVCMAKVDLDTFIGIEMQSYGVERHRNLLQKILAGGHTRTRMAVIGPASRLTTVRKDSHEIQARILAPQSVAAVA